MKSSTTSETIKSKMFTFISCSTNTIVNPPSIILNNTTHADATAAVPIQPSSSRTTTSTETDHCNYLDKTFSLWCKRNKYLSKLDDPN
ncbi:unnamed protein product [Didymodactylos carnosus]|uniref:Uncharacterized protein n=1 Tax=Didymodactylos carnosus TaxID=1234261 RepID=A0A814M6F9_9BILA|nr:unnamed protein product [Didymodactylos carnosus]CAF1573043.1 unnamed protein product [Didymodactylos carnosus]CAF3841091.1 unnamed protein product [Didymodactylos carnosus]CAF4368344.1 unnamed protein product [Didymodactylos carnosus]